MTNFRVCTCFCINLCTDFKNIKNSKLKAFKKKNLGTFNWYAFRGHNRAANTDDLSSNSRQLV